MVFRLGNRVVRMVGLQICGCKRFIIKDIMLIDITEKVYYMSSLDTCRVGHHLLNFHTVEEEYLRNYKLEEPTIII